ncbi:hypothetical protein Barb4_01875 [Bacteroidales bacterium Barb4]|nr:hypothetical protein Barb4_01875 [Bacteroidales bacterium Barb4]
MESDAGMRVQGGIAGGVVPDYSLLFGVYGYQEVGFSENTFQRVFIVGQQIAGGGAEEEFDARYAALVQAVKRIGVVVCPAEEKGVVYHGCNGSLRLFPCEGFRSNGRREGVRHIHESGNASGGGGTAFAGNVAFVHKPRFAEMYMAVNDTGQ